MNNLQSNKPVTKCSLFCGEAGSGKTTAIFKFLSVIYRNQKDKVQIISLDTYNVKGRYECQKFCEIGQVEFKTLGSIANSTSSKPTPKLITELETLLLESDEKTIRLIDFSGVKFQSEWIHAFKTSAEKISSKTKKIEVFTYFCIPAFTDLTLIQNTGSKLEKNPDTLFILTHCDSYGLKVEDVRSIERRIFDLTGLAIQFRTFERITSLFVR